MILTLSWNDFKNTPSGSVRCSMLRGVSPPGDQKREKEKEYGVRN
jgi:hypothetical protein